jgi:hypothetical protein
MTVSEEPGNRPAGGLNFDQAPVNVPAANSAGASTGESASWAHDGRSPIAYIHL